METYIQIECGSSTEECREMSSIAQSNDIQRKAQAAGMGPKNRKPNKPPIAECETGETDEPLNDGTRETVEPLNEGTRETDEPLNDGTRETDELLNDGSRSNERPTQYFGLLNVNLNNCLNNSGNNGLVVFGREQSKDNGSGTSSMSVLFICVTVIIAMFLARQYFLRFL